MVTNKENTQHAFDNGLVKSIKGEDSFFNKLSEKDVINIFYDTDNCRIISEKYNVSRNTVVNIKRRKKWKYLTLNLK